MTQSYHQGTMDIFGFEEIMRYHLFSHVTNLSNPIYKLPTDPYLDLSIEELQLMIDNDFYLTESHINTFHKSSVIYNLYMVVKYNLTEFRLLYYINRLYLLRKKQNEHKSSIAYMVLYKELYSAFKTGYWNRNSSLEFKLSSMKWDDIKSVVQKFPVLKPYYGKYMSSLMTEFIDCNYIHSIENFESIHQTNNDICKAWKESSWKESYVNTLAKNNTLAQNINVKDDDDVDTVSTISRELEIFDDHPYTVLFKFKIILTIIIITHFIYHFILYINTNINNF
jgi:hypothetical protein